MQLPPFSPQNIDAVFFDLDGTLIDTDDVDVNKWAHRFARVYGDGAQAEKASRRLVMFLETPLNAMFTLLDLVGLDTPVVRLLIKLQGGQDTSQLPAIAGTSALIVALAEYYKVGIVSTRTVAEQRSFIKAQGLEQYISVYAGRDTTWRIKPHPQPVRYAADQLGFDAARCLMVGDTTVDVRSGLRAGAKTCAVLCGYGQQSELERAGAHIVLEHTSQLNTLLLSDLSQ